MPAFSTSGPGALGTLRRLEQARRPKGDPMIVRIDIDKSADSFGYRVGYESEELYADDGLESIVECLVAAVEGMPPEAVAAELWYDGVVSGTYPLPGLAMGIDK